MQEILGSQFLNDVCFFLGGFLRFSQFYSCFLSIKARFPRGFHAVFAGCQRFPGGLGFHKGFHRVFTGFCCWSRRVMPCILDINVGTWNLGSFLAIKGTTDMWISKRGNLFNCS